MSGQQVHLLSNLCFHGIAHSKLLALKEEKEQIVQKFGVQVVYYLIIFCRVSVAGANWTGRFGAVYRAVWHGTIIAAKSSPFLCAFIKFLPSCASLNRSIN